MEAVHPAYTAQPARASQQHWGAPRNDPSSTMSGLPGKAALHCASAMASFLRVQLGMRRESAMYLSNGPSSDGHVPSSMGRWRHSFPKTDEQTLAQHRRCWPTRNVGGQALILRPRSADSQSSTTRASSPSSSSFYGAKSPCSRIGGTWPNTSSAVQDCCQRSRSIFRAEAAPTPPKSDRLGSEYPLQACAAPDAPKSSS